MSPYSASEIDPGSKRPLDSMLSPSRPSEYPKKRVSIACEVCRARKTRCDASRPSCAFCVQSGAVCVYRGPALDANIRSTEDNDCLASGRSDPEVLNRLGRIEALLETLTTSSPGSRDFGYLATAPSAKSYHTAPSPLAPCHNHTTAEPNVIVGHSVRGLSRLAGYAVPGPLVPLSIEDGEDYLELEMRRGKDMFPSFIPDIQTLDLTPKTCWRLQQSFIHFVLPWCPFIDQQECAQLVTSASHRGFPDEELETCLSLFILALGSIAKEAHRDDNGEEFHGIHYFQVAAGIVCRPHHPTYSILAVQCRILMAFYYLFCLRPVQAFDAIHQASLAILGLLQFKTRLEEDHILRQHVYRAYWACYLTEHELQSTVSYSSCLLQGQSDFVPLPSFDHDEPGGYWFLSEIAFRRIFSSSRAGAGWNTFSIHESAVVHEIDLQVQQWYDFLPSQIKFPTDLTPLASLHKVFLRAQYYAIVGIMHWSSIVQLLTLQPPHDAQGHSALLDAGSRCLEYCVMHVLAVESLLQERHLLLMANISGLNCIANLLICTYNVPALVHIQHPRQSEAISKARGLLENWVANPVVANYVNRIDDLLMAKDIGTLHE